MLQSVGFTNYAIAKDAIWFCDIYHSNLLKMQLDTGKINLEMALLPENISGKMQYGPIVCIKDKIILAPRNAGDILVYDIFTKLVVRFCLKKRNIESRKPLFISGFVYREEAFFIPGNYPAIIKVNVKSMLVEYFENFYYDLPFEIRKRDGILCNSNALVIDNFFVFPIYDSNIFIKIYLDFSGYEIERIGTHPYKIWSMVSIDEDIWFAGPDGIFEYLVKKKCIVCHNKAFTRKQLMNGIGQIIDYYKELVIIPVNGEKIILFHTQKNECTEFEDYTMPISANDNGKHVLTGSNIICLGKINDDVLCIFSTFENEICLINLKNHLIRHYEGILGRQSIDQLIELYITHTQILNETDIKLNEYISYVSARPETH